MDVVLLTQHGKVFRLNKWCSKLRFELKHVKCGKQFKRHPEKGINTIRLGGLYLLFLVWEQNCVKV